MEDFFPRIQVKTKKKVFTKNGRLFSQNSSGDQRSDADQSQIIGGNADANHTQIIGGDTVKLLGDVSPPFPPGFGTPESTEFLDLFFVAIVDLLNSNEDLLRNDKKQL